MNSARRRRLDQVSGGLAGLVELPVLSGYSYGELTIGRSKNGFDIRCGTRASAQPSPRILVEVELRLTEVPMTAREDVLARIEGAAPELRHTP